MSDNRYTNRVAGRRVRDGWHNVEGEIVKWDPLSSGMCDILVRRDNGDLVWLASYAVKPIDGRGPLPSRQGVRREAAEETLCSLRAIRSQHIADFHKPWPGAEFGKAIIGQALNDAIASLEEEFK